jgi:transposase
MGIQASVAAVPTLRRTTDATPPRDLRRRKTGIGSNTCCLGAPAKDNRLFDDAVLWIAKTGSAWPDLPDSFGQWNSLWRR